MKVPLLKVIATGLLAVSLAILVSISTLSSAVRAQSVNDFLEEIKTLKPVIQLEQAVRSNQDADALYEKVHPYHQLFANAYYQEAELIVNSYDQSPQNEFFYAKLRKLLDQRASNTLLLDKKLQQVLGVQPQFFTATGLSQKSELYPLYLDVYLLMSARHLNYAFLSEFYLFSETPDKALQLAQLARKTAPQNVCLILLEAYAYAQKNRLAEAKSRLAQANTVLQKKDPYQPYLIDGYPFVLKLRDSTDAPELKALIQENIDDNIAEGKECVKNYFKKTKTLLK